MAYDAAIGKVVLWGGAGAGGYLADTWEWDGTTWSQLSLSGGPETRSGGAMAYDPASRQLVLFGGEDNQTQKLVGDTWTFDGSAWTRRSPSRAPSARADMLLTTAPNGSSVILFGGYDGTNHLRDLWAWDGATWTPVQSTPPQPDGRERAGIATSRSGVVTFGGTDGNYQNDSWTISLS
jgi:hypothetical protein